MFYPITQFPRHHLTWPYLYSYYICKLTLTTSLQNSRSPPRRCPMLCSTTHALDSVTPLTFSAESTQHQLSIMTLTTHLLISIPQLEHTKYEWNIVRQAESHRHTLKLILAAITPSDTIKYGVLSWTGDHKLCSLSPHRGV